MSILCTAGLVSFVSAQDKDPDGEEKAIKSLRAEMKKSAHHKMNMALRQNIVNLAKTLSEMAKDEKKFDQVIAGIAIEEIEHSLEKMEEIHSRHLATLSKKMREKIEAQMEKRSENEMVLNEHICELSVILQAESLDLKAFADHVGAIVAKLTQPGMEK
jgi:uncharacterized 2Fe-2S/4Fe-4S cluster protein (DUF4445 family)